MSWGFTAALRLRPPDARLPPRLSEDGGRSGVVIQPPDSAPWGSDEHGGEYCFLAIEPDADAWRIVVGGECGEWFETAGTFCDFLVRCFDRRDRPPFMARDWPGEGARYQSHA